MHHRHLFSVSSATYKRCPHVGYSLAVNGQYQLLNGPSLIGFTNTLFSWEPQSWPMALHNSSLVTGRFLPFLLDAWWQVEMSHKHPPLTMASSCFTGCFWHSQLWLCGNLFQIKKKKYCFYFNEDFSVASAWFPEATCCKRNLSFSKFGKNHCEFVWSRLFLIQFKQYNFWSVWLL